MVRSLSDSAVESVLRNPGAMFPSPEDWRDCWIYFLLVDRFNHPVNPPRSTALDFLPYQGGNFEGIRQQLPYLQQLGVKAIWLSPVSMNPQWFTDYYGGYATLDFLRIEPRFCTDINAAINDPTVADREFRTLVDAAHALGIYVILDIVINHVGDLFNYEGMKDSLPWKAQLPEYQIFWRDASGRARGERPDIGNIPGLLPTEGVWPQELQRNDYFRRRGDNNPNDLTQGDFGRLKEIVSAYLDTTNNNYPVRNHLIRACQYLIAKFDLDGFRIDTLQYVEPDFARVFGNAMREYALSIGKKNFFTFGEIWSDDEAQIARFVGRNTQINDDAIGVDAAIDFPMRQRLVDAVKGFASPSALAGHFDYRQQVLRRIISSRGDAGRYYVTFLDNHDLNERFHNSAFPAQTQVALTCLLSMQGVPCIYYGTEQGLEGRGGVREFSRGTLWGRPAAFSTSNDLFRTISQLSQLRDRQPALRYGRQYFRVCSGDGIDFGYSNNPGGIIAFSRILNDREVLVVANTDTRNPINIFVAVDANLHQDGKRWDVLFSTASSPTAPDPTTSRNRFRRVRVNLQPMEAQILG